jgi:hypothetical protein
MLRFGEEPPKLARDEQTPSNDEKSKKAQKVEP